MIDRIAGLGRRALDVTARLGQSALLLMQTFLGMTIVLRRPGPVSYTHLTLPTSG